MNLPQLVLIAPVHKRLPIRQLSPPIYYQFWWEPFYFSLNYSIYLDVFVVNYTQLKKVIEKIPWNSIRMVRGLKSNWANMVGEIIQLVAIYRIDQTIMFPIQIH